ncbi:Integrin alpha chain [Beggiatoa sp. SS]|nr:Integrin alpha chain [Beggiatoa sp. SS]
MWPEEAVVLLFKELTQGDASGFSVSGAGDINQDGLDDLMIGAPYADRNEGESYVVFAPSLSVLMMPTNLTARPLSQTEIRLSWIDQSDNESHFIIGRSTESGRSRTEISVLSEAETGISQTYSDADLKCGTTYYYVVRSHLKPNHNSANTREVSATTAQCSTETRVDAVSTPSSATRQTLTLNASVNGHTKKVDSGTLTFTLKQGSQTVGRAVTSEPVFEGHAQISYPLSANMAPGTYTIETVYSGSDRFASSRSTATLTIEPADSELTDSPPPLSHQLII